MKQEFISKARAERVDRINQAHIRVSNDNQYIKKANIQHMREVISVGKMILKEKNKCKHGEWEGYFSPSNRQFENGLNCRFAFGKESAKKYMKLAKYPQLSKFETGELAVFSIDKVYLALSDATPEKEQMLIGQHSLNEDDEYHTPAEYIESARKVMVSIDCDPASNDAAQLTVNANQYFTIENSGLDRDWNGNVWLNPPYSRIIGEFSEKLVREWQNCNIDRAIVLTNNGTDTTWFHNLLSIATSICILRGRIKFIKNGKPTDNNNKGQIIFYMGSEPKVFKEEFLQYGSVWNINHGR